MRSFLVTLFVRWLGLACSLLGDACAAYSREGLRAAFFEVGLRACVLHSLTLGAPVIFGEMLRAARETDSLRSAWLAGESVGDYVRRRCEEVGVPLRLARAQQRARVGDRCLPLLGRVGRRGRV